MFFFLAEKCLWKLPDFFVQFRKTRETTQIFLDNVKLFTLAQDPNGWACLDHLQDNYPFERLKSKQRALLTCPRDTVTYNDAIN